jgi:hypothetical protein
VAGRRKDVLGGVEVRKKSAVDSGFAMRLVSGMDEIRRRLGVAEEEFRALDTPAGEPYLERMIAGLGSSSIRRPEAAPAVCPKWVVRRFTPDLEARSSIGIAGPRLWLHDRQKADRTLAKNTDS